MASWVGSATGNPTTSVTSGNVLAAFIQWNSQTITLTSVSTNRTTGNLTLSQNPTTDTANGFRGAFAVGAVTSTGTATFTPVWSGGTPGVVSVTWIEVTAADTTTPIDNAIARYSENEDSGPNTPDFISSSAVAVLDQSFIWGVCGDLNLGGTRTPGTVMTSDLTGSVATVTEYMTQSGNGSRAATFTTSNAFGKFLVGMLAIRNASTGVTMTPAQFAAAVTGTGNVLGFKIGMPDQP